MYRKKAKIILACGLWVVVLGAFAPSVYRLYSLEVPESEIFVCSSHYYQEHALPDFEQKSEEYNTEWLANLSSSEDPNDQVMSLLAQRYGSVTADDIQILSDLNGQYTGNSLIAAELLTACVHEPDNPNCAAESIGPLMETHVDNGAIWGLLASLRYAQEDEFGVTAALRRGARSPTFDDLLGTQLHVLNAALPDAEVPLKSSATVYFFVYADATIGSYSQQSLSRFCAETSATNPNSAEACLTYGERIVEDSSSLLGAMIGNSILEVTYSALGNNEAVRELAEQRDQIRSPFEGSNDATLLMYFDEKLFNSWIDDLIAFDEVTAITNLVAAAKQASQDPNYRPCEPDGLHFDFPYFYLGDQRVVW